MRSAEHLGTATKPINIFYGLSQGARALAAARLPENDGRLSGHGIKLEGSLDQELTKITVVDNANRWGSFTTVARLLGSPSLPRPVELGALLAALPLHLPRSSWSDKPGSLMLEHQPQNSETFGLITRRIYATSSPWPDVPELREGEIDARREWATRYLRENYPCLDDFIPMPEAKSGVGFHEGGLVLTLLLESDNGIGSDVVRAQTVYERVQNVAGWHAAVPRIGGESQPLHPLVPTWACLWTFSMLARYEPVRWTRLVDVDASGDATALDEALEDALDLVPALLVDALQ